MELAPRQPRRRRVPLLVATYALTGAVLVYIGATTDLAVVARTMARVGWGQLLLVCAGFSLVSLLLDALSYQVLFRLLGYPARFRTTVAYKGVGFLLNLINYQLAGGVAAAQLHREHRVPLAEAVSVVAWMAFVDLVAVALVLVPGLVHPRFGFAPAVRWPVLVFCLGAAAALALAMGLRRRLTALPVIRGVSGGGWLSAFESATPARYGAVIALRVLFRLGFVLLHLATLPLFGLDLPPQVVALHVPFFMLAAAIPLSSVAGLGTPQVAMRMSYGAYVPGGVAPIDAFAVTVAAAMVLMRVAVGLAFLHRLWGGRPMASPGSAQDRS